MAELVVKNKYPVSFKNQQSHFKFLLKAIKNRIHNSIYITKKVLIN